MPSSVLLRNIDNGKSFPLCATNGVTLTGIRPNDFVLVDEKTKLTILHLADGSDAVDTLAKLMPTTTARNLFSLKLKGTLLHQAKMVGIASQLYRAGDLGL
jgi:hypothetical protein